MATMIPTDLKYTSSHEWVGYDPENGEATIGITQFAAEQFGDIVFVELPAEGSSVTAGRPFGVIESSKAAVDLTSPLSGEVFSVNQAAIKDIDIITKSPFSDGWLIKIKISNPAELDLLMDADSYSKFTGQI